MLEFIGVEFTRGTTESQIEAASKLLLPGVGSFDRAMIGIRESGLRKALDSAVLGRGIPVLGVCLGMQLLGKHSEEGEMQGLGWLNAKCIRLTPQKGSRRKVPNNGWQIIAPTKPSPIFDEGDSEMRFYFNHSFHMVCHDPKDAAATTEFDGAKVCAVARANIYGVQFHPEKSHRFGMKLLSKFAVLSS